MTRSRLPPEARRDAILDAATACFSAHGPAVSTAKIARAAGVSEALLFHYFPSKDALWIAAASRTGSFAARLRALVDALDDGPLAPALVHLARAYGEVLAEERQIIAILLGAALRDEPLGAAVRTLHIEGAQALGATLAARGALRPGIDPEAAAVGFLGGFVLYFILHHRDPDWGAAAEAFAADWVRCWCPPDEVQDVRQGS